MTTILIVEADTPETIATITAGGGRPTAEAYGAALSTLAPGIAVRIVRPYFPGFELDDLRLAEVAGAVFTGSAVHWSADARDGRIQRRAMERVLAAGIPSIGSCNGLQLAAVVLGGTVRQSPSGIEVPIAREVRLTPRGLRHALHAGRAAVFDVPCIHRDEVADLPAGAELTATNEHSEVQAMVCESGGVRFWGMQYHPERSLADIARAMRRRADAAGAEAGAGEAGAPAAAVDALIAASDDPAANGAAIARHRIAPEVLDFGRRSVELRNWLAIAVRASGAPPLAAE